MSFHKIDTLMNIDSAPMCRLCLSCEPSQYVSLHVLHQGVPLANIISLCFGIKIPRNEELVQTVCNICWNEVIKYNELREKYLASDKILREAQRIKCVLQNEPADQRLVLSFNPMKETSGSILSSHQHGMFKPSDEQFSMNHEDCETPHFVLSQFVRVDHNGTEQPGTDTLVHTDKLEQTDSSKIERAIHNTTLFCCGCNPSPEFTSAQELNTHCNLEHTKYRISDNSIRPFECNTCFQRFLTETLLRHHKNRPYRKRSYVCTSCSSAYFTNSALKRHENVCKVMEKNYTCEDCGKRFRQIVTLKNHRKLHKTEKTFSCSVCLKAFKQKFELPIHMVTHTGEQPFPCDQCPARFKRKQALKNHQHRHVNPRPFKCDACDEWFGNPTARKFHRQTVHEGLDPFRCEQCGLSYGRRVRLKQHMKKVHGEAVDGE
ncbi:zinc finger protein 510-like [Anopheles marshallii]|uniref:zinc finger protein 510-like n=1 Tax=Anopheles marshallii TaxID=1521116 RepID=UPI00237AA86D|nr:zinc finger protein 510-like [Anopheles marshallii]